MLAQMCGTQIPKELKLATKAGLAMPSPLFNNICKET